MSSTLGIFLRTARRAPRLAHARLAGPRAEHADVTFPVCPGCGVRASPVFRVDFRAAPFAAMDLWPDTLVTLLCHNRCDVRGSNTEAGVCRWWDHRDPLRPVDHDASGVCSEAALLAAGHDAMVDAARGRGVDAAVFGALAPPAAVPPEDIEFEEVSVVLEPRRVRRADVIETASRVGGEPAWLQRGFRTDPRGQLVEVEPEPPACPRCARATAMLVQWSETGMDAIPRRVRRAGPRWQHDEGWVLGNPAVRFWFGCAPCRMVGSLAQMD